MTTILLEEGSLSSLLFDSAPAKKKQSLLSKLITSVGNFSVQYNFQSISVSLIIMAASVCTTDDDACREGDQAPWVMSSATATVFVGAITGQLSMGYLGDLIGRDQAMTITLGLVSVAAMLSAAAPTGSASSVYITIIATRFLLGIGVGGVYPLAAVKAAEDGGGGDGGVDMQAAAWAFFWQVPGSMTPWLLALIFSYCDMSNNTRWRLLLGLGAVPAAFVVVCSVVEMRIKKREKELDRSAHEPLIPPGQSGKQKYRAENPLHSHSLAHAHKANETELKHRRTPTAWELLQLRKTWVSLLVSGGCWFIYDVAYYGVNLFGGEILTAINASDDDNVSADTSIHRVAMQQLLALSMGIPACIGAIYSLQCMSLKTLQVYGFLFITACFLLLACLFAPLSHGPLKNTDMLFALYCLLLFSLTYGPNLTTFILPAQMYPREVRATFNGISAACGKLGAFTGVYVFGPLAETTSYATVMVVCAALCVVGALISEVCIVPLKADDSDDSLDESDDDSVIQ
ncbi:major facilitator superfamily domain-containing protein [Ochromonadaceae sp. CCMP2298]|nr:major facilitator superfamily domain-containing protein [Ochromonadaceae sp. CCMP2298]